jgi:alcohol acetyltransferase
MCARNVLDTYIGTGISCRYTVPANLVGPSAVEDLQHAFEQAVALTALEHSLMQAGLANEKSNKPAWTHLESIDLGHHITWVISPAGEHYEGFLRSSARDLNDIQFLDSATRPGWRIVVTRPDDESPFIDVLFNWNHPYFDGTGGKIFHQTLLRVLSEQLSMGATAVPQLNNHILTTTTKPKDKLFIPSVEKLTPASATLPYMVKTIAHELSPAWLSKPDAADSSWAPTRLPAGVKYETIMRGFFIEPSALANILAKCRARKTTLTALLHGISFVSLIPALQKRNIDVPATASETAISLRRFAKDAGKKTKKNPTGIDPENSMVCCVSVFNHRFGETLTQDVKSATSKAGQDGASDEQRMAALENLLWAATDVAMGGINDRLRMGMKNEIMGLLGYAGDLQDYFKLLMEKPRHFAWLITNIGVIDGKPAVSGDNPPQSAWGIQKARFTLSADITGPAYEVSTISVKGGELSVHISWPRGMADDTIGDDLTVDLEKWLLFLAGTQ